MKKMLNVADLGGAPITKQDLRTVFNFELWNAIDSILNWNVTDVQGFILTGCVVTGAGPYNVSEGIVFLSGEFRVLPAATGVTLPAYIVAAADVDTTATFADGSSHALFREKKAAISNSIPGTQYITLTTTSNPQTLRNILHLKEDVINNLSSVITTQALSAAQGKALNDALAVEVSARGSADTALLNRFGTLNFKVVNIGDWDMDATASVSIAHGVTSSKIRSISVMIRHDTTAEQFPIDFVNVVSGGINGGYSNDATNVILYRVTGGWFDGTDYDATSFNRGFITIAYTD